MSSPEWVSIVAPFASGAFGVGVAYGVIRQQILALKDQVHDNKESLKNQVGDARCREYRAICRAELKEDIARIENRKP